MPNLYAIMQGAGCLKQYHVCILRAKYCDFLNQCSISMHSSSMHKARWFFVIPDGKVLDDKTTYYLQNKKYLLLETY